jgi:hypothetical protein
MVASGSKISVADLHATIIHVVSYPANLVTGRKLIGHDGEALQFHRCQVQQKRSVVTDGSITALGRCTCNDSFQAATSNADNEWPR